MSNIDSRSAFTRFSVFATIFGRPVSFHLFSILESMFDTYCTLDDLKGLDLITPQPLALLYQTGYLTIKSYNSKIKRYRLGIPNEEVKKGLFNVLLPYYMQSRSGEEPKKLVGDMVMYFILGDADKAMKCMQAYFAGVTKRMMSDVIWKR